MGSGFFPRRRGKVTVEEVKPKREGGLIKKAKGGVVKKAKGGVAKKVQKKAKGGAVKHYSAGKAIFKGWSAIAEFILENGERAAKKKFGGKEVLEARKEINKFTGVTKPATKKTAKEKAIAEADFQEKFRGPTASEKAERQRRRNEKRLAEGKKKGGSVKKAKGGAVKKKQGSDARLDESLGERRGKESTKSQSFKSRRNESRGASKPVKKASKPKKPQSAGAAKRGWGAVMK